MTDDRRQMTDDSLRSPVPGLRSPISTQRPTRADVIAEARSWIGTPWRHQGRLKGIASDCVGLLIGAARARGLLAPDFDVTGYSRFPEPEFFRANLERFLDRVEGGEKPADVLWIRPRHIAQHVAILTDQNTIIHAIDIHRGVAEHIFDRAWRARVVSVYRFRGIDD